nr:retrovirus-related Pol polyprotein from transposon TNT 1-94 [Tanacetum cinerariifolium]
MTRRLSEKPRQQERQNDRKCFRYEDPNHLIGKCPKPPKDKNQRAFVGGSWSDSDEEDDEKVKDETCIVAQASSENKRLKAIRNSLENEIRELKEKLSKLEKNKRVDLECTKCQILKIDNEKLKWEALKITQFEKSTHSLNEMLSNQKLFEDKLGLGFNSFEASSSGTKEMKFAKPEVNSSSGGGSHKAQTAPKAIEGPHVCSPYVETSVSFQKSILGPRPKHIMAYNGGNVIFGSNLRGNIIDKGQIRDHKCRVTFSKYDSEITKDGKVIGRDFKLFQMDVKSAFLNGFINEEVYVAQPSGFIDFKKSDHVYKLKKALYGLKQEPKACSTCKDMCDDFAKIMHDEFEMNAMGELNFFIGLQIKQMKDGIFFNQSKYTKEMLKKFSLKDSKPIRTPMASDAKLTKEEEWELVDSTKYRGMIGGNQDHVSTCLCHMLYYIATSTRYNLAFFILKRMEAIRRQHKVNLPYGMLLTRLFKHIVSNSPKLSDDRYILCDRVMYPPAPYYERKTRADHGTKRCRQSNSASSSSVFVHTSPSHYLDDNDNENEEDNSRTSTLSPSQFVNSLSNVVPQVFKNPPHENQTMHTYKTQILNHQSQYRDEAPERVKVNWKMSQERVERKKEMIKFEEELIFV